MFPQMSCMALAGGSSTWAACTGANLAFTVFPFTPSCTGWSTVVNVPLNNCMAGPSGNYVYETCMGAFESHFPAGSTMSTTADASNFIVSEMLNATINKLRGESP